MTRFVLGVLIILGLTGCPTEKPIPPVQIINYGDGLEAPGKRVVFVLRTDGTEADAVAQVTSFLNTYEGYKLETITPIDYRGGGKTSLSSRSFILVARNEVWGHRTKGLNND